ncbi:MAG: DUF4097 family beta strand repeat-containing protein [Steroidobacteraceae bacterium]
MKSVPLSARNVLPCAIALVFAAGAAEAGSPIDKRATVDPDGSIEISNVAGTVGVSGWDRNEVEVTGELGDGTKDLEFVTTDKVTRIKVVLPDRAYDVEDTNLVVKVPARSRVSVNTVSADTVVSGVQGAQRLQSVSGNVSTTAGTEDVECKTVSGDVRVEGSGQKGMLTITTVSGDASALRVAGEVNANTVSGDLVLGLGETQRSRLRSTSGDIVLATHVVPDSRFDVETISGDVRLSLHGNVDAEFDVSTFNGDISNCFGPKPASTNEYAPGQELRFREGQGSARIRIKTLNGDVNLCRK